MFSESEINTMFHESLFSEKSLLKEDLTSSDKNEVKSIIRREIEAFVKSNRNSDFEKWVENIIKRQYSSTTSNKELDKKIIEITKKVLTQLYKSFWTKKSFWVSDLTNIQ
jgi:hypothetical protein